MNRLPKNEETSEVFKTSEVLQKLPAEFPDVVDFVWLIAGLVVAGVLVIKSLLARR